MKPPDLDAFDRAGREAAEGRSVAVPEGPVPPRQPALPAAATGTAPVPQSATSASIPAKEADFAKTDIGNAEHFAALFGARVRFDHRRQRWLLFGKHHWRDDDAGRISRVAKIAIRRRQKDALGLPDAGDRQVAVKWALRSEYREASDPLADFLGAATVPDPEARTRSADLYRAYVRWADRQGLRDKERLSNRRFGERMRAKHERKKSGGVVFYSGIRLLDGRTWEGGEGQPSLSGTSPPTLLHGEVSGNATSTLPPSLGKPVETPPRRSPSTGLFASGVAHSGPSESSSELQGDSGAVQSPPSATPPSAPPDSQPRSAPPPGASDPDDWTQDATAEDRTRLADLRPIPPTQSSNP